MPLTSADGAPLRLGGVSFLNAQPLLHGLLSGMGSGRLHLLLAEPAVLARKLFEDELDAALAPVAPLALHGGLDVVPDVAIGCDGPVRSVVLVAQRPLEEVQEVWLDAASRTSVILARLILRALRQGKEPAYCARPAEEIIASVGGQVGGLIIGDAALDAEGRFKYVVDLGQAWKELTGLPFVFAVWVARRERLAAADCALLQASAEAGLAYRTQIAQAWARGRGGDAAEHAHYLHHNIAYRLDPSALQGLREFLRRAAEARLLPATELRFVAEPEPSQTRLRPPFEEAFERAERGERLSLTEAMRLYRTKDLRRLSRLAHRLSTEHAESEQPVAHLSLLRAGSVEGRAEEPECFTRPELVEQVRGLLHNGLRRVVIEGPLPPGLHLEWFENLFSSIAALGDVEIHALDPDQVVSLSHQDDLGLWEVLQRLQRSGLSAVYGGRALVLTDRVRGQEPSAVCDSATFIEVLRQAHRAGMRTWVSMEFGGADQALDRVLHLLKLRDLQDETGGLSGLLLGPVHPEAAVEDEFFLRTVALARVVLDNLPHVQVSRGARLPLVNSAMLHGADGVFGAGHLGALLFTRSGVRPVREKTVGDP